MSPRRGPSDHGPDAIPALLRFVAAVLFGALLFGMLRAAIRIRAEHYLENDLSRLALLAASSEIGRSVSWAFGALLIVGIPALLLSLFAGRSFSTVAILLGYFPIHDLVRRASESDPAGLASRFRLILGHLPPDGRYVTATVLAAAIFLALAAYPIRAICRATRAPSAGLAAAALLLSFAPGLTHAIAQRIGKPSGPNVLLITIDTLRADHMSAYGYPRPTSPVLDRLAERGTLFDYALAPTPRTTQTVASIMTSLYPQTHGIRTLWGVLGPERVTLAERFRDAGYVTAGFWTTTFLDEKRGLAQGFMDYEGTAEVSDRAELVTDRAILWLADKVGPRPDRGRKDTRRPFFLWLHYRDPHMPYNPPPEERLFVDHAYQGEFREGVRFFPTKELMVYNHLGLIDSADVAQAVALYDGEVRYCDRQIGRLFKDLDDRALTERTLVVVTADHGEALSEHGYYFDHGDLLFDSSVRVPLIIAGPDVPRGRVRGQVSLLDIAPTVLGLVGLPESGEREGRDLRPEMTRAAREGGAETAGRPEGGAERAATRYLFGESGENLLGPFNIFRFVEGVEGKWRSVRTDSWKLTMTPKPQGVREYALYDLAADPAESTNVLVENAAVAAELTKALDAFLAVAGEAVDADLSEMDQETQQQLRSMGYLR